MSQIIRLDWTVQKKEWFMFEFEVSAVLTDEQIESIRDRLWDNPEQIKQFIEKEFFGTCDKGTVTSNTTEHVEKSGFEDVTSLYTDWPPRVGAE